MNNKVTRLSLYNGNFKEKPTFKVIHGKKSESVNPYFANGKMQHYHYDLILN